MPQKHFLSLEPLSQPTLEALLASVSRLSPPPLALTGQTVALLHAPGAQQRLLSFAQAAQQLGGGLLPMELPATATPLRRHDYLVAAKAMGADYAVWHGDLAMSSQTPIPTLINAGHAKVGYPTQALKDAHAIAQRFHDCTELTIGLLGQDPLIQGADHIRVLQHLGCRGLQLLAPGHTQWLALGDQAPAPAGSPLDVLVILDACPHTASMARPSAQQLLYADLSLGDLECDPPICLSSHFKHTLLVHMAVFCHLAGEWP